MIKKNLYIFFGCSGSCFFYSEALWPGDRCDLAGTPLRGIGISEESEEKIHKAGTPSWTIEKRLVEGKECSFWIPGSMFKFGS